MKRLIALCVAMLVASAAGAEALQVPTYGWDSSFWGAVQLTAGTTYPAKFRAMNVTCSSSGSANITLADGSVLPYTFSTGSTYQIAVAFTSVDAIPSGCRLDGLK